MAFKTRDSGNERSEFSLAMTPRDYIPVGPDAPIIDSGEAAAKLWQEHVAPEFRADVEWTITLLLGADQRLLGHLEPESDGAKGWIYPPTRRVLRAVLLSGADSIVHLHSHPTGPALASDADRRLAHSMANLLGLIDASLFDFVTVTPDGREWFSMAESGDLEARAVAIQDVGAERYEQALATVLELMGRGDERFHPLVSESANLAGKSIEQWLADFLVRALSKEFNPAPTEDRRLCFASAFLGKNPDLTKKVFEAHRRSGKGLSEFIWEGAQAAFEKELSAGG